MRLTAFVVAIMLATACTDNSPTDPQASWEKAPEYTGTWKGSYSLGEISFVARYNRQEWVNFTAEATFTLKNGERAVYQIAGIADKSTFWGGMDGPDATTFINPSMNGSMSGPSTLHIQWSGVTGEVDKKFLGGDLEATLTR